MGFFLPFAITYYLNGHRFIEQQLRAAGVAFRKNDNYGGLWGGGRELTVDQPLCRNVKVYRRQARTNHHQADAEAERP